MAGKGNTFANEDLLHVFNNANIALIGDATGLRGSTTVGSLYAALHTADPGPSGVQTTSEVAYSGYIRKTLARDNATFTVSGRTVTLAANADFPASSTSGTTTALYWSIGTASSGAGKILYYGGLGSAPCAFTAIVAGDVITIPGQAYSVSDRVQFYPVLGLTLPTGLTEGTVYYVKTVSGNDVTISATDGGATVDITAAGAGLSQKISPITIVLNTIPRLTTGTTVTE